MFFDEVAQELCDYALQYLAYCAFERYGPVGIWFGVVRFVRFAEDYCESLFERGWEVSCVYARLSQCVEMRLDAVEIPF